MKQPIGIFDSGLGGLTVVKQVRRALPNEDIVYFGDTARVPYGIKSQTTVTRFAVENCNFLLRFNPKMIVVACNTASATSLPALAQMFPLPICGVIEPGARRAVDAAAGGAIGIIGTESTIESRAYHEAIEHLSHDAEIVARPCPLLVPIVEEGRVGDDEIVGRILAEYLGPLKAAGVACLVLGCTHYPLLKGAIAEIMGTDVTLIDSSEAMAEVVREILSRNGSLSEGACEGQTDFWVSDNPERFARLGERFLEEPIRRIRAISADEFFAGGSEKDSTLRVGSEG